MLSVESDFVVRPYAGKDHDRVFLNDDNYIYGVFDGAGTHYASEQAICALDEAVISSDFSVIDAIGLVHAAIRRNYVDQLTTGSLIKLTQNDNGLVVHYAGAGDSPLYVYDVKTGDFRKLVKDEASRRFKRGIEISNFLGHPDHRLRQAGHIAIESAVTCVLATDGITDSCSRGRVKDKDIRRIMASDTSAGTIAKEIVACSDVPDDASVIVVKARLA